MTPYKQLLDDDCFRTAIGCILNIKPKKIPNWKSDDAEAQMDAANAWLRKYKLKIIEINLHSTCKRMLKNYVRVYGSFYALLFVRVLDVPDGHHAMVCRISENEIRLVHDPGELKNGTYRPTSVGLILPAYN